HADNHDLHSFPTRRSSDLDDSALFRQGLAGLLAPTGVQVSAQAATADEAAVRIAAGRPDVVIMDIRMPPTYTDEGLQATAQLKKDRKSTRLNSSHVAISYA